MAWRLEIQKIHRSPYEGEKMQFVFQNINSSDTERVYSAFRSTKRYRIKWSHVIPNRAHGSLGQLAV